MKGAARRAAVFLGCCVAAAWLAPAPATAQTPDNTPPRPEARPDAAAEARGGISLKPAEVKLRKEPAGQDAHGITGKSGGGRNRKTESRAPAAGIAALEEPLDVVPTPTPRPEAVPETASLGPSEEAARAIARPVVSEMGNLAKVSNAPDPSNAREAAITPAAAVLAAAAVEDARMCEAELEKRGVLFTIGESISDGACGVLRPVNIERLSSGVAISSGTKLLCGTALALDRWMTDSVVPAAKVSFPTEKLAEFRHASTYVCRNRSSENGISEHARGSAVDIAAFSFKDGTRIGVETQEPGSPEARFQRAVREGACGPFKTVLGPGTDADHATHFHLDIAARRNGSTYCK